MDDVSTSVREFAHVKLLRPRQVAEILGISQSSTYRLDLPRVNIGGTVRFKQADVEAYVASQLERAL